MPTALYTPRVNNNDDTVRLSHLFVETGARIKTGDPVADVETDKATFTVEAENDGYLLTFNAQKGDTIEVGSVLAWIGSSPDEAPPGAPGTSAAPANRTVTRSTTLKAALLLAQYGIEAWQVPSTAERVSAEDVERYLAEHALKSATARDEPSNGRVPGEKISLPSGKAVDLTPEERGMLRTVEWHKREAASAYVEIAYEESAWSAHASEFQKSNKLLMSPLLSLIAWRLVQVAKEKPLINATLDGRTRHEYEHVNLGFTVQAGQRLYVAVVNEAEKLDESAFVQQLGDLQRRAMKGELRPDETSGATVCFSSMARWPVTRHMPILMPYTSFMLAHTAPRDGRAVLGATYDHRILSGAAATLALLELAHP